MDSFIEEFFEEWMDYMIDDTPFFSNTFGNGFVNDNTNLLQNQYQNTIQQNLVSSVYRLRRTIEIENQVSQLENNMFQNIYEILTDHLLPQSDLEDVKVVLQKSDFDKLKHFPVSEDNLNEFQELRCNICMENYILNDEITKLDCNHFFHFNCIEHWLCNEHVTCPICRKDTRESLINNNQENNSNSFKDKID